MKIKFIGAVGGQVTGSCTLCCAQTGTNFLVDCGVFQGGMDPAIDNRSFPFDPRKIKFVLLTHAHADHCGRIPDLYKCGFIGKIICTEETMRLSIEQFADSEKQKTPDQKQTSPNDWEERFFIPEKELKEFKLCVSFPVDNNIAVTFLRSSHLLGSVSIGVSWKTGNLKDNGKYEWKEIFFSGDLGPIIDLPKEDISNNYLPLLKDGHVPYNNTDYLVLESTYGNRRRTDEEKNFKSRINKLGQIVTDHRFNTFVFPCFAMQRTQDVLFDLLFFFQENQTTEKYQIVLDSPMGIKISKIYKEALCKKLPNNKRVYRSSCFAERFTGGNEEKADEFIREVLGEPGSQSWFMEDRVLVQWKKGNEKILPTDWKVIYITSSGMFVGGPVIGHLRKRLADPKTAFAIMGYQATKIGGILNKWVGKEPNQREGSLILSDKQGEIEIDGINTRATIYDIGAYYSGHADAQALLRYLFESSKKPCGEKPTTVFLNHGSPEARLQRKEEIEDENQKRGQKTRKVDRVEIPDAYSPFFDLERGCWDENFTQIFYKNSYPEDFDMSETVTFPPKR